MHNCLQLIDYNWKDLSEKKEPKKNLNRENLSSAEPALEILDESRKVIDHNLPKLYAKNIHARLLFERQPPAYISKVKADGKVWVPIGHVQYLLKRDAYTQRVIWSIETVDLVCSPRKLSEICMSSIIHDWPCRLPTKGQPIYELCPYLFQSNSPYTLSDLPDWVLECLLSEAIIQKDCAAISGLVSVWPSEVLKVVRLIPNEELPIISGFLTKPVFVIAYSEESDNLVKGPSLLDAFLLGLLSRQNSCQIKSIDFCGFEEDLQLSLELSRIPVLWMSPTQRYSDCVKRHLCKNLNLNVSNPLFERYFTKISEIYAFHETELNHGENFDPVTINLDCNVSVDEVAIGLSLQFLTPFRFTCHQLTVHRFSQFYLPAHSLIKMFDPLCITRFELEDPELGSNSGKVLKSVLRWLMSLRNLRACSLPACILSSGRSFHDLADNLNAITKLNKAFLSLRYLQRIGLSRCNLNGKLKILLSSLVQPIEYLNLKDCSLNADDLKFLVTSWRPFKGLYELNISRNDFSSVPVELFYKLFDQSCLHSRARLACLSIAYTCLSMEMILSLLSYLINKNACESSLRVLCLQSFTPPSLEDERKILNLAVELSYLRWLYLYPTGYTFPGNNLEEQNQNRAERIQASQAYVKQRERYNLTIL